MLFLISTTCAFNAPISTKVVCFSRLLKCLRSLYGNQCGPRSDCCSGSTLFAFILNLSVMLGNYLQQTTFSDALFSGALRTNNAKCFQKNSFRTTIKMPSSSDSDQNQVGCLVKPNLGPICLSRLSAADTSRR